MEVLDIVKDDIPYSFKVKFDNGSFFLSIKYNSIMDRFYIDLYDEDSNVIYENEMIQYGIPLWYQYYEDDNFNQNDSLPLKWLIAISADGVYREVNFKNLQENVFIAIVDKTQGIGELDLILYGKE